MRHRAGQLTLIYFVISALLMHADTLSLLLFLWFRGGEHNTHYHCCCFFYFNVTNIAHLPWPDNPHLWARNRDNLETIRVFIPHTGESRKNDKSKSRGLELQYLAHYSVLIYGDI